jgi:tetratricopeptide (TPR) repeat protein
LINRGIAYFNSDQLEIALRDFNTAERTDTSNRLIYSYRSRIHFKLAHLDKAQSDLKKYLDLNPYDPFIWSNLGMVTRVNKQYAISLEAYNRAIEINPDNLDYYYKRSKTYYQMGDIQMARNDLSFLRSSGFKEINPEYERLINQGGEMP